jgi:hypothetical protein
MAIQGKTKNQTLSTQQKQREPKHEKSDQSEVIQDNLKEKTGGIYLANVPIVDKVIEEVSHDDLKSEVTSVSNMAKVFDARSENHCAPLGFMLTSSQGSFRAPTVLL